MKLLLDESVDVRFRHLFPDHDARTVNYMGWNGVVNGELLALARREFDAFITCDRGIPYQQNIGPEEIPIIVLYASSNSMRDLEPLAIKVLEALPNVKRGQVVRIYPDVFLPSRE